MTLEDFGFSFSLLDFIGDDDEHWDGVTHLDIRMNVAHDFVQVLEVLRLEKPFKEIGQWLVLQVRVDVVADVLDQEMNELQQLDGDQL